MNDRDIERLDFILDRLIQFKGHIDSNTLHQHGFYDEYSDDQLKIDNNFEQLQSEFYKSGASRIIDSQDDYLLCYCVETSDFKKEFENFENYYSIIEENRKVEETKNKEKETIENRKNRLVNFKYFIERPKTIIVIILTVLAFVFNIENLKDLVNKFRKDKEDTLISKQDSVQTAKQKPKEIKSLECQLSQEDSIEKKTNETKQKATVADD